MALRLQRGSGGPADKKSLVCYGPLLPGWHFFLRFTASAVGSPILPPSVLVAASFSTRSCLLIPSNLWGLLPVSKEMSQPPSQPCWTLSRSRSTFTVAASLHCILILTTFRPAVSQACLVAVLAFFIPCPNDSHDGLTGLPLRIHYLAPPFSPGLCRF